MKIGGKQKWLFSGALVLTIGFVAIQRGGPEHGLFDFHEEFQKGEKAEAHNDALESPSEERKLASSLNVAKSISDTSSNSKKTPMEAIEAARGAVPSLNDLEREYRDWKPVEMARELKESQDFVAHERFVEKSNQGELSEKEVYVFLLEMRKQATLSQLQVKQKIAQMKRKYL